MLKQFILPVQTWLLSQKRCVGCGMPLAKGLKVKGRKGDFITCKCKRIYFYNPEYKTYRRALISEI
jgi:hypothetical protein